jgi:hypothetical protein
MAAVGALLSAVVLLLCLAESSSATNVTYDHRALVIDGVRRVLVSGSIHYPRSTPDVRALFLCSLLPLFFLVPAELTVTGVAVVVD